MSLLEKRRPASPYIFQALTYHRVLDGAAFAAQMAYLVDEYRIVGMDTLLAAAAGEQTLPPHALLITFDDAYQDFADVAWPILQRHGFPVTLFVPSGFAQEQAPAFWWDVVEHAFLHTERQEPLESPAGRLFLENEAQRRQAVKRVKRYLWTVEPERVPREAERLTAGLAVSPPEGRVLGWGALRRLAAEGVTLGAHTRTHPNLARLGQEEARQEIAGSWHDLCSHLGAVNPVFAYPGGHYRDETVGLVAEAGFQLAFTTQRGANDVRDKKSHLELRRINVNAESSVAELRVRLLQSARFLNRFHGNRKGG
jgi:peptidoglycan/xylan/chitin deacetylase (PgdA/CDA1 family)